MSRVRSRVSECSAGVFEFMANDDDELQGGEPIVPGPDSVGFVPKQSVTFFEPPTPLKLAGGGGELPSNATNVADERALLTAFAARVRALTPTCLRAGT